MEDPNENAEPTYEELAGLVASLITENEQLRRRIAELETQIKTNPRNSSKPPSSEGYKKPPSPTRQQQRAAARKVGKQRGAAGNNLKPVNEPDEMVNLDPPCCENCGAAFDEASISIDSNPEIRQVFGLPEVRRWVTQYRASKRRCTCRHVTKAQFPSEATAVVCYSPEVRALAVYLIVGHHLPYDRAAVVMSDICGLNISPGSLSNMVKSAAVGLGDFETAVREALASSPIVHFDETGARAAGKLMWAHSASTDSLTAYFGHGKRGVKAINAFGILSEFIGVAVHDGWRSYRGYDVLHGLCNAHHTRELIAVVELGGQDWASELISLLVEAKNTVAEAKASGDESLGVTTYVDIMDRYDNLIKKGKELNPKVRGRKQSKATNLLRRLEDYKDDVMRFTTNFDVPWDNNQAERDIRMVKLQQKISGCWRTAQGLEDFLRIRSYISTAKKQGKDVYEALVVLFKGNCWMPSVA